MLKRITIFGLLLLIAGAGVLRWNVARRQKEQQEIAAAKARYGSEADQYLERYNQWLQLPAEQRDNTPFTLDEAGSEESGAQRQLSQEGRLKADLGRLAGAEMDIYPFADILYGENWRKELARYRERQEEVESVMTAAIACTSAGAAIMGLSVLVLIVRVVRSELSALSRSLRRAKARGHGRPSVTEPDRKPHTVKKSKTADAPSSNREGDDDRPGPDLRPRFSEASGRGHEHTGYSAPAYVPLGPEKLNLLLSDSRTAVNLNSPAVGSEQPRLSIGWQNKPAADATATMEEETDQDSLSEQTEMLEKQMEEVRQMAENVQKTTLEQSAPLNTTLTELAQQVSAIREYAAHQQERVERLQDGYDWNIIRTFCLRVIRCIDNLESRIRQLAESGMDTTDIEEVRDELLFALESSGVEQFRPHINSDYRGQEKCAEAVKERQQCEDESQAGKIADVIRPGYQYFINEENTKVVRTAQVKLYG